MNALTSQEEGNEGNERQALGCCPSIIPSILAVFVPCNTLPVHVSDLDLRIFPVLDGGVDVVQHFLDAAAAQAWHAEGGWDRSEVLSRWGPCSSP